ncbi:MAG: F0F1 ATP synthase subunit B [Armatimonadota bacterium]|nr:MAG: F0F1 ATP synthase subunit B [Armatimonadota bacterium]
MLAVSIFEALGLNPAVLALQALVFLVLLWVLRKFLFAPVQQMLRARERDVDQHLNEARERQAAAEKMREELQHRLDTIQDEARRRMREAADEAKAARDEALADARDEAEKLLRRAASEIDLEKRKAIADLREQVANLALTAASKAIQDGLDEEAQRRVIDQAIAGLEQEQ